MQKIQIVLLTGICFVLTTNLAFPILLEPSAGKTIGGFLITENATHFTVRVPQKNGEDKVEVFEKSKVKVLHKIAWDRVEKLTKDNPKAYRDLGEVMAEKAKDPEARELALRLFLIAAYLDPDQLGRSCLLSMSQLAGTPEENKKYRAMAYLLDPKHDPAILKIPDKAPLPIAPTPKVGVMDPAMKNFLQALRFFRTGKVEKAKEFASKEGVAPYFGKAPDLMDHGAFLTACQDSRCKTCSAKGKISCKQCKGTGRSKNAFNQVVNCQDCNGTGSNSCQDCNGLGTSNAITPEQTKMIIRAELWAIDQHIGANPVPVKKEEAGGGSWITLSASRKVGVPNLTLETISPFDPRKCVYRNGNWIEP